MVYGAHCQQRGYKSRVTPPLTLPREGVSPLGRVRGGRIKVAVGEDDVVVTLVNSPFGIKTQLAESRTKTLAPLRDISIGEGHGQLDGVEALIAYVAEKVELSVGKHRLGQAHHLAVALVGGQNVGAHSTYILRKAHHQFFPYGVYGGVGNLGKLLAEIVEQQLRAVAQYGEGSIVAHSRHRFLPRRSHRHYSPLYILLAETEVQEPALVIRHRVIHLAPAPEFLQLYAVSGEPLGVGMLAGELRLYLSVVVYPALLCIHEQYLARLQPALAHYVGRFKIHHAHL